MTLGFAALLTFRTSSVALGDVHHVTASRPRRVRTASPRMVAIVPDPGMMSPALDVSGKPATVPDAKKVFHEFFSAQEGSWNSERTYHYTDKGERETSATTFDVVQLDDGEVDAVLKSNGDDGKFDSDIVEDTVGFRVSFLTKMESQSELFRSFTDLAFVPLAEDGGTVRGNYYRLYGYEERGPQLSSFNFDAVKQQLNMITWYTSVVSVDQIWLINPMTRVRTIINYRRPAEGDKLEDPLLVGFGVEKKRKPEDPKTVS